ncbi:DUF3367 domain-containing protein, partial [Patescibacteria group bacterium]|nr:DUF3367 domain-containing protein [Patescibacteria group bacterium]
MFANTKVMKLKKWFAQHWVQVFLTFLLLLTIRFFPFFFNKSPIYGDNFSLMVPGKLFTAFWVKQGIFPFWNPTILAGVPWLSDVNQSLFYPSTFLFLLFSPGWALNIDLIIHFCITFIGTYVLAKKLGIKHLGALAASIIWTLSPQFAGAINNLSIMQSLAWVPWVVLAGINLNNKLKAWLIFSLIVTIQFLGGYPQHIIFTIGLGVIFSLISFISADFRQHKKLFESWREWLLAWFITGLITLGMTSFIWLPFLENLTNSTRMIQSSQQLVSGSLHPIEIIKLVFPYFFEKPTAGYRFGINWNGFPNLGVYVSWLGLLLPFLILMVKKLKPRDKFYFGVIIVSLLLSLGGHLPGFVFLQKLLPLGSAMRGPSIILFVTSLVFALWIGDLITRIKNNSNIEKKINSLLNIGIIAGGGCAFLFISLIFFKFDWVHQLANPYLSPTGFFN